MALSLTLQLEFHQLGLADGTDLLGVDIGTTGLQALTGVSVLASCQEMMLHRVKSGKEALYLKVCMDGIE